MSVVGRAAVQGAERLGLFDAVKWYAREAPRPAAAKVENVLAKSPAMEARARRIVDTGRRMVGSLRWQGGTKLDEEAGWRLSEKTLWGRDNDFGRWMRGTGPEPGLSGTMACTDAVMYIAHRAGAVDEATLRRIHEEAADAASAAWRERGDSWPAECAFWKVMDDHLLRGERTHFEVDPALGIGGPDIPAGHVVMINNSHAMTSLGTRDAQGRQEVLSHWVHPERMPPDDGTDQPFGRLQQTSVQEVVASMNYGYALPIDSAAPFWLLDT
ncbi:hypothetical protein [Actinoallomurus iriomotensis]|uniref:Uncharacterized protein n=1 Tax=Actinoallomurus iriomotensis TaxID=478107 RepID=A0A9W6S3H8_9ACTN|nr:hypothetical protein [Actinoallomurus iriomotensis]GLY86488.1 hypothetical protein Airi02_044170 [Actinoallomurus iriomotensis]